MEGPSDHVIVGDLPVDLDEEALKTNFEAYGTIKWCKLYNGKGGKGSLKSAIIEFGSVEEATWLVENLNGNVPLGLEKEVTVKFKPKAGAWVGGTVRAGGGGGAAAGGGGKGLLRERPSPYGVQPGKGGRGLLTAGRGAGKDWGSPAVALSTEPSTIGDLWKGLVRHKILPGGTWENDEKTVCVSGLPSDTTDFDLLKIFSPFGAIAPAGVRVKLNEDGTAKGSGMVNFLHLESAEAAIETLNNCMMPDGRYLKLRQFNDSGAGEKGAGKAPKKRWAKPAEVPVAEEPVEGPEEAVEDVDEGEAE